MVCGEDEETAVLWWLFAEERHEGLEDGIREARTDGDPFDYSLDAVDDNDGERGFVGVHEYFGEVGDLHAFAVADHVFRGDELDKGIVTVDCDFGGQGGLSGPSRAV